MKQIIEWIRWFRFSTYFPNISERPLRWHELIYCPLTLWPMIIRGWIAGDPLPMGIMVVGRFVSNREWAEMQPVFDALIEKYGRE